MIFIVFSFYFSLIFIFCFLFLYFFPFFSNDLDSFFHVFQKWFSFFFGFFFKNLFQIINCSFLGGENPLTLPQARQWWRRLTMLKRRPHSIQIGANSSGTHCGFTFPRLSTEKMIGAGGPGTAFSSPTKLDATPRKPLPWPSGSVPTDSDSVPTDSDSSVIK